jgi:signal transduction histidine kinase
MRERLRGLRESDWRTIDRVMAVAFVLAVEAEILTSDQVEGPLGVTMLLYGLMAAALWWRRDYAVVVMAFVIGVGLFALAWFTPPPTLVFSTGTVMTAGYSVGAHSEGRASLIGLAIAFLGVVAIAYIYDPDDVTFPVLFFGLFPWLAGRVLRGQLLLARELSEKAERVEHAREVDESRAIAEERRRVARELHDVLAHDLSVIVVQASAAQRIIETDPSAAAEAAELVGRTGREALAELRHLFGPVRRGEGEPLEGSPRVSAVARLADRARDAGLPVELRIEGTPRDLPAGVDLTGYRVVQEALTNALRHAGAASASVLVRYESGGLVLEVADDGVGPEGAGPSPGGGHGLVGMRERVALYGGELEAGERRGGGFAVRARLPLNGAAS